MNSRRKQTTTDLKNLFLSHRTVIIVVVALVFFGFGTVYAIGTIGAGFRATSSSQTIDAFGVCKEVRTTSGNNVFVPTKTSAEWSAFRNNKPANVTLGGCFATNCAAIGGTVYGNYCRVPGTSCPVGWNTSVYVDSSAATGGGGCSGGSCSIPAKTFVNGPGTCSYDPGQRSITKVCDNYLVGWSAAGGYVWDRRCRNQTYCWIGETRTVTAPVTAVYCYL